MTTSLDPEGPTLREAADRYHHDPLFHARVHSAVITLRIDAHGTAIGKLTEREARIATQAACLGLLMAEFFPSLRPVPPPSLRRIDG